MNIREVTTYHVDGKEFPTLQKARTHIENEIGRIVDSIGPFHPKERLDIFNTILAQRERLVSLLTTTYENEDPEAFLGAIEHRNILDL